MTIEMPARATMKSCESQGKDIMSLRDMMAIIKSESGKPRSFKTIYRNTTFINQGALFEGDIP